MAKYTCNRPVESLHGKLKKSDKVGFARLKSTSTNYTVTREDWKQVFKTEAAATAARQRQAKFRAVAQAAHERKIDPTKKTADEAAFKAQSKYKTMFTFLFHLEWEAYEG